MHSEPAPTVPWALSFQPPQGKGTGSRGEGGIGRTQFIIQQAWLFGSVRTERGSGTCLACKGLKVQSPAPQNKEGPVRPLLR